MIERLRQALDHLPERMQDEVAEFIEQVIGIDERDWQDVPYNAAQAEIRRNKRVRGNMLEAETIRINHQDDEERAAAGAGVE